MNPNTTNLTVTQISSVSFNNRATSKDNKVDSVRLVDGGSENVGRVEMTVNGVNGTICDDRFDYRAAVVICRMLGFKTEESHFRKPNMVRALAQLF